MQHQARHILWHHHEVPLIVYVRMSALVFLYTLVLLVQGYMVEGMFNWIHAYVPCAHKTSYTRTHRIICKLLVNGLWTKCAYKWMGLRTCSVPSANGLLQTEICRFSARTQRELDAPGVLFMHCPLLASGLRKIN